MDHKCHINLLFTLIAAMTLGGLGRTAAMAGYSVLMLDFSNNNSAAQTEPGFTSFTISDSGKVVDGIKIELAGSIDARWRAAPTGIPYERIYRDFIFARPGGMTVTLSGLEAKHGIYAIIGNPEFAEWGYISFTKLKNIKIPPGIRKCTLSLHLPCCSFWPCRDGSGGHRGKSPRSLGPRSLAELHDVSSIFYERTKSSERRRRDSVGNQSCSRF
jgi:hypothetical protein